MRDIKFRAWDKSRNIMLPSFSFQDLTIVRDDLLYFVEIPNSNTLLLYMNEPFNASLELMQYTGLSDKNGIEIYEGDYVDYGNQIFQVASGVFGLTLVYPDDSGDEIEDKIRWSDIKQMEVIGNVRENKDLLNRED